MCTASLETGQFKVKAKRNMKWIHSVLDQESNIGVFEVPSSSHCLTTAQYDNTSFHVIWLDKSLIVSVYLLWTEVVHKEKKYYNRKKVAGVAEIVLVGFVFYWIENLMKLYIQGLFFIFAWLRREWYWSLFGEYILNTFWFLSRWLWVWIYRSRIYSSFWFEEVVLFFKRGRTCVQPFHDIVPYCIGFYMIGSSVMKELTAVLYSLNDLRRLNLTVNIIKTWV